MNLSPMSQHRPTYLFTLMNNDGRHLRAFNPAMPLSLSLPLFLSLFYCPSNRNPKKRKRFHTATCANVHLVWFVRRQAQCGNYSITIIIIIFKHGNILVSSTMRSALRKFVFNTQCSTYGEHTKALSFEPNSLRTLYICNMYRESRKLHVLLILINFH